MNRTRRILLATLLAAAVIVAARGESHAQAFQPYWTARAVPDDSPALGAAVGFGDEMFRLAGHGRFSITSVSDLGLELVFDNFENEIGDDEQMWGFGGDFKYLVVPDGDRLPFDLAAQGCFGLKLDSDFKQFVIPFGVLGSKSIPLEDGGREITPFAGAYVVVEHFTYDGAIDDETETSAEIRIGSAFQVKGRTHAYAAIHAGNGTMFFLGFTAGL